MRSSEQTFLIARQLFGDEVYQALLKRDKQYNHDFLSTLGYIADVGDAGDGLLYALEGDYSNAKWSLSAVVPIVGSAIKPAKKVISGLADAGRSTSKIKQSMIKELLNRKDVEVASIKEADALLKQALPDAVKVKGSSPNKPDFEAFKGKNSNGLYHKD
jgi:hypothetical protein